MELLRSPKGRLIYPVTTELVSSAVERFRRFCRFQPETGCVVWIGGTRSGRGHNVPYSNFWFNGYNWLGHRWAAKFIHGQDIEGFHTDHCCPNIPIPNTLCVEHVQSLTPRENRELQHTRRKNAIHMQVGLLPYEDVYGVPPEPAPIDNLIPFYEPPAWLQLPKGPTDDRCPF
jgi:hypothetical protein